MAPDEGPSTGFSFLPWARPRYFDDWLARTEHWSHLVSSAAGLPLHRRVLVELLEALGGGYVGSEIEMRTGSGATRFLLDGIEITSSTASSNGWRRGIRNKIPDAPLLDLVHDLWSIVPGAREFGRLLSKHASQFNANLDRLRAEGQIRLDASNVRLPGGVLERVTALIDDLRLEPGRSPTLASGSIDLMVSTTLSTVAQWIELSQPGTAVRADANGQISVQPVGSSWSFGVEPSVVGTELRARVVRVSRFGLDVGLPQRFVRSYAAPIPAPDPLSVVAAELLGTELIVHYRHPGMRQPLSLEVVRELMQSGTKQVNLTDLGPR